MSDVDDRAYDAVWKSVEECEEFLVHGWERTDEGARFVIEIQPDVEYVKIIRRDGEEEPTSLGLYMSASHMRHVAAMLERAAAIVDEGKEQ